MRSVLKVCDLEDRFPILTVESNCIVSEGADTIVTFGAELPELYAVTAVEYETIHGTWVEATKVLPSYSAAHRQDWLVKENYRSKGDGAESLLFCGYEHHLSERPYLRRRRFLYLAKTTHERVRRCSDFSTLCRGYILPKEITNWDSVVKFLEAVEQFECITNDSGHVRMKRLRTEEVVGTEECPGLIKRYLILGVRNTHPILQDICLDPKRMRIGNKHLCLHMLSDTEDLPGSVGAGMRYGRLFTDRSNCRPSFAAPVGLLPSYNRVYSQYVFTDGIQEILQRMEKTPHDILSLSKHSRSNAVNYEWTGVYLDEAHMRGFVPVRCHCNVLAWAEDEEGLRRIKNDTGSRFALMGCIPHYNTIDTPVLYWSGIPGNTGDFPAEEGFYTFLKQAARLFASEANYHNSPSPFGIHMIDKQGGIPLHLDISDLPMRRGIITNRNKFILGLPGGSKSFFANHLVHQYYEQDTHILLVDTEDSYQELCSPVYGRTHGGGDIYITYKEDSPIAFSPFYTDPGESGMEKRGSIKTLIFTLWKHEDEAPRRSEEVIPSGTASAYIHRITEDGDVRPDFSGFYEFVRDGYRRITEGKEVRKKDFNIDGFLNVLEPFYRGGGYGFLFNSDKGPDLISKRSIVFELDNISGSKVFLSVVTLIVMETFITKIRRLKDTCRMILIEECRKALMSANMNKYIKYLLKIVREYFGEAMVVTQEVNDIISSSVVREAIINSSDCKIFLDQRKYMNKLNHIQRLLGLTDKERGQILSTNQANHPGRLHREVWIGSGSTYSAAYATKVSNEEYAVYTMEESEKLESQKLTKELGGNLGLAVRRIAETRRERKRSDGKA